MFQIYDLTLPTVHTAASSLLVKLIFIICAACSPAADASQYSPPGLYDIDHIQLENGLNVIMKHRPGAHTLSIRLWVGVGTQDFPCESRETPHFLEHLLFTGTSRFSEAELESRMSDHGGSWNAYTGTEKTVYEIDIYSRYSEFAINTLYEILTDSTISESDVETSRAIIHRESGGRPSGIRQWFRNQGFGVNATEKAVMKLLPDIDYVCEGYVTAEGITRGNIIETYDRYYVPGNMALIIVGDMEKATALDLVKRTFGRIHAKTLPQRNFADPGEPRDYQQVTGTLSPMLSNEATVGIIYKTPGYWSDDTYALMVIEQYLSFRVIEELRINRGLAYAPNVWRESLSSFGLFAAYADVDLDAVDTAMPLIEKEINHLVEQSMDDELLEKSKMKILLLNVQGYEANSSIADYYASEYAFFNKKHYFEDVEEKIEAVTVKDISRVAQNYLSLNKGVVIYETPTLSYTQLYLILVMLVGIVFALLIYFNVRRHVGNRNRQIK